MPVEVALVKNKAVIVEEGDLSSLSVETPTTCRVEEGTDVPMPTLLFIIATFAMSVFPEILKRDKADAPVDLVVNCIPQVPSSNHPR